MSYQTKKPIALVGSCTNSGNIYTGEVPWTRGGAQTYSALSGVNVATVIYSGGGRLNSILVTANLTSGQSVLFVDAVPIATSGMPLTGSGAKAVGVIPPVWAMGASGLLLLGAQPGQPQQVDVPFFSGLLACPVSSGTPAFSVSFTPECSGYYSLI